MNLLIVSVPDFGHVRAVAAIARVLRNRGHQVYWISSHAIVDYASRAGAVCLEVLPDQLNRDPVDSHLLSSRSMYSWPLEQRFVSLAESALEPTIAAVKGLNLDLVLTDEFALWGPMVADFLGKPWATYCPGLFFSSRERQLTILAMRKQDPLLWGKPAHETSEPWQIGRRLNAQRRKLGLDAVPIFGYVSRSLVLCFTSRAFEYGGAGLPAQARCVGPIFGSSCDLDPRPDGFHELPSGNDPLVYVALGDDFGDREELFHLIKEGLKSSRMHVLFGGASNGNPPVSQAHVLKRASLTVCHGGLNTVQESLCYGVPVIAIPLGADQSAVAGRLEDLQLGLQLSAESFAPSGIQGAVRSALSDDGLTERVRQFQMEAKLSNSTTRAACLLENLAANGSIEASEPTQILELLPERPRFAERFRLT
jgi:zeaxanthin glucosyltransferase